MYVTTYINYFIRFNFFLPTNSFISFSLYYTIYITCVLFVLFDQAELLISDAILDDKHDTFDNTNGDDNGNDGDCCDEGDDDNGGVLVVVVIVVVAVSITSDINSDNNPILDKGDPNNDDVNDDFIHVGTIVIVVDDAAADDLDDDLDEHGEVKILSISSTSTSDSSSMS